MWFYLILYVKMDIAESQTHQGEGGLFIVVELTESGKEARRQYYAEYRRKNREKKRKADIRYWNKQGEQLANDKKSKS